MNKEQFLNTLKQEASLKMNRDEVEHLIEYYDGYIDEAIEFGMNEYEIIQQLGDIHKLIDETKARLADEKVDVQKREIHNQNQNILGLEIDVRNTSVILLYEDIDCLSFDIDMIYQKDYLAKFENGIYKIKQYYHPFFQFEKKYVHIPKMYVHIPKNLDLDTKIKSKNASITIPDGNEKQTQPLLLETSNSNIEVRCFQGNQIILKTSNSKIVVEDIKSQDLTLLTSNAKIVIDKGHSQNLDARTKNAKIEMIQHEYQKAILETTNAKIACRLLDTDFQQNIQYSTTNGKVLFNHQKLPQKAPIYIEGQKPNKELEVYTTNAKIEIIY